MTGIKQDKAWIKYLVLCLIIILYAVLTAALSYKLAPIPESDLNTHAFNVIQVWKHQGFEEFFKGITYPGWHALVRFLLFLHVPNMAAAVIACVFFACLSVLAVWYTVSVILGKHAHVWLIAITTCALLMVSAIYIPWYNPHPYLGQGSPTVWHNPTYNAVKPFALLSCVLLFKMIERRDASLKTCTAYALLSLVCLLMKPSFFQIQAPGVFLYLLLYLIMYRDWKFVLKIGLSFVPIFLYMAVQFWMLFYAPEGEGGGIAFMPFALMVSSSPSIKISTLLLLAFPLYAILVLRKTIFQKSSPYLPIICMLLVGFLEYTLFIETGDRAYHGNFAWGYMLAVFLCWAFFLPLFVKKALVEKTMAKPLAFIGFVLVLLHFVSGCVYYGMLLADTTGKMVY